MKKLLTGLMLSGLILASPVYAQEEGAAPEMSIEDAKAKYKEVSKELGAIRKKAGTIKRKFSKNDDVIALKKAADEARKAYDAKLMELIKTDPEGAEIAAKMEALSSEMAKLKPLMRPPKKAKAPKKKKNEGGEAPAE